MNKLVIAVIGGAASIGLAIGIGVVIPSPPTYTTVSVPASYGGHTIASDCSSDATAGLDAFLASLSTPTIVTFASGGCYDVSNSTSSLLQISDATNLTLDGNGATLQQTTWNGGSCSGDPTQPILGIFASTNVVVNNLTIYGSRTQSGCGGSANEGGYGLYLQPQLVGSTMTPDTGITVNDVTFDNIIGDGFIVNFTNTQAMNTNIVVQNSTLEGIGYHAFTLEAVDGFNFTGNTVDAGPADFEVDGVNCATLTCFSGGQPTIGQVNVSIVNNDWTQGGGIESSQSCVPVQNWTIAGNTGVGSIITGYMDAPCPTTITAPSGWQQASGLMIFNNDMSSGGYVDYNFPGIENWTNVVYQGNQTILTDGWPGVYETVTANTTSGSARITVPGAAFTTLCRAPAGCTGAPATVASNMFGSSQTVNGAYISGPGIPANTIIILSGGIVNATTLDLNAAATATATGVTLTIGGASYHPNAAASITVPFCGDTNVQVKSNTFNNSAGYGNAVGCSGGANTNFVACGNTWGLTLPYPTYSDAGGTLVAAPAADPLSDAAC